MKRNTLYLLLVIASGTIASTFTINSVNKFAWLTGHDLETVQLIPAQGTNPIVREKGETIVHVKFKVVGYGEVSFPINTKTAKGAEAMQADLSKSKGIQITYQANHQLILQLRQTGVHGGVHNQVTLSSAKNDTTITLPFSRFKGGKKPLDLTDVAKFNFAFLGDNPEDGYAELKIRNIEIK